MFTDPKLKYNLIYTYVYMIYLLFTSKYLRGLPFYKFPTCNVSVKITVYYCY